MAPSDQPDQPWSDSTNPPPPIPHWPEAQQHPQQKQPSSPSQKTLPSLTSPKIGTFYFAYGSNLSPSQMSLRLPHTPHSSTPIAIARLDGYRWLICQRGYANVVKLPPSLSTTPASHSTTVWGVLYNLDTDDEATLDRYEGHNEFRNPDPEVNPDVGMRGEKPYEQGNWDYNKLYLKVAVTRWLVDPGEFGVSVPGWKKTEAEQVDVRDATNGVSPTATVSSSQTSETTVRVLVYVDELRTEPGRINFEYIGRMNRAIDESTALGFPQEWVDAVMRKFIVPDVHVKEDGYVGTDQGYVEAEATEAYDEMTENTVRVWREKQGGGWS